jgi:3-hydroxyisobutyrate dehydrogenase-like beta-hydroxyacid dehydrogenase
MMLISDCREHKGDRVLTKIGFIGLGLMGRNMAMNLIRAGYSMTVWNRTKSKMSELVQIGAKPADCPKDVAENSDVVITMVSDSPDVEAVIMGDRGIIEGAHEGLLIIDMSTISPEVTRRIASGLKEKGVEMLDAPVSGGDIGARDGTLSIMVGGSRKIFRGCFTHFQSYGKENNLHGVQWNGSDS